MKNIITILFSICSIISLHASTIEVTTNDNAGLGSLREAIAGTADTIFFQAGIGTIELDATLKVLREVVIIGNGPDQTIVKGDNAFRLFDIVPAVTGAVTFRHMAFVKGGYESIWGGAIIMSGTLTVHDCVFDNNVGQRGGAIYVHNANGRAIITQSIFSNNTATDGGAVHIRSTTSTLSEINTCLFYKNTALSQGGGLYQSAIPEVDLIQNTIVSNTADEGGGVYSFGRIPQLINNIVAYNQGMDLTLKRRSSSLANNLMSDTLGSGLPLGASGNIIANPVFVDSMAGDYRLVASSAGVNDGSLSNEQIDLDGKVRTVETTDIGAYEYHCKQNITINRYRIYVDSARSYTISTAGDSWSNAYPNLQYGIDATCDCPASIVPEIWVAKGTYSPTYANDVDDNGIKETREKTFYIDRPVQIYGGFDGDETDLSERDPLGGGTILTGVIEEGGSDTAYHVITLEGNSIDSDWVLDGLVIRDGRATGFTSTNSDGGGIYASASEIVSPIIIHCTIHRNYANKNGGGAFFIASSNANVEVGPSILNSSFYNNKAFRGGGGYFFVDAGAGKITAKPTIINSTIFGNNANKGGGAYVSARSRNQGDILVEPAIANSTIYNNFSNSSGGGFHVSIEPRGSGSKIIRSTITNSILWDNASGDEGPDIWMNKSDGAKISHSIVTAEGLHVDDDSAIDTMTFFLHDAPFFINAADNNLRLSPTSPAINAGFNQAIASSKDLDGKTRLIGDRVDMGAYESGIEDNCDQNVFLHPQEFTNATEIYSSKQSIFATNKITSTDITYDALLGIELGLQFEVASDAVFQAKLEGCE